MHHPANRCLRSVLPTVWWLVYKFPSLETQSSEGCSLWYSWIPWYPSWVLRSSPHDTPWREGWNNWLLKMKQLGTTRHAIRLQASSFSNAGWRGQAWGARWAQESSKYELREDLLRSSNKGLNSEFSSFFSLPLLELKAHTTTLGLESCSSRVSSCTYHGSLAWNFALAQRQRRPFASIKLMNFSILSMCGSLINIHSFIVYILLEVRLTFWLAVSLVHI